jgi:hypothetical protein
MKRRIILTAISVIILGNSILAEASYWPKQIKTTKGIITLYQPQAENLQGNNLTARAAVSVKQKKDNEPVFGAFWFDARLFTDRDERMVTLQSIHIRNIKFPDDVNPEKVREIKSILETEIPQLSLEFPLDELLTTIEEANEAKGRQEEFNNEPPEIIIKNKPAVLITIDGNPKIEDIENSDLQQVVNTPYFIIFNPRTREYWLYGDGMWFVTTDAIKGRWTYVGNPPVKVKELIDEQDEEANQGKPAVIPEIVVRTTPAELIVIEGEPQLAPIEGTGLLYVKNSESDIFLDIKSQFYFILLSGRWYASSNLQGPWKYYASDRLPEDFSKIPEGSEKDKVLASVAGTDAANEAKLDAIIPQTATVRRSEATVEVSYDGNPKFIYIPGTRVAYAENSPNTVLLISNRYYVCENGVWFESDRPFGPWAVCVHVPGEVQEIPPSSPVYHVKYVYIYDYTPEVVYVGYTPAYTGCYIYGPTVVYGTGYHYHSWYGRHYYPRPWTYGYHMHYNPYTGWSIGFSMSVWRPYSWFTYYHSHPHYHYHYYGGYWGPPVYRPPYHYHYHHYYGQRPAPHHPPVVSQRAAPTRNIYYGHRSGVEPTRRIPASYSTSRQTVSSSRSSTHTENANPSTQQATRPSTSTRPVTKSTDTQPATRPVTTQPSTRPSTSSRPFSTQTSSPTRRTATTTTKTPATNNIYTDKNGNIYRRTGHEWQKRENNTWKPETSQPSQNTPTNRATTRPSGTTTARPDLERQSYSRERGVQRSANAQTIKPASSSRTSSQTRTKSTGNSSTQSKPQTRTSTSNAGRR